MESQNADVPVEEGAEAVIHILLMAHISYNGKFQNIQEPGWKNNEGPNNYNGKNPPR